MAVQPGFALDEVVFPGPDGYAYGFVGGTNMESFGSPSSFFRMRGYDTTLAAIVYWDSTVQNASEYAGPGPLTDIVVLD